MTALPDKVGGCLRSSAPAGGLRRLRCRRAGRRPSPPGPTSCWTSSPTCRRRQRMWPGPGANAGCVAWRRRPGRRRRAAGSSGSGPRASPRPAGRGEWPSPKLEAQTLARRGVVLRLRPSSSARARTLPTHPSHHGVAIDVAAVKTRARRCTLGVLTIVDDDGQGWNGGVASSFGDHAGGRHDIPVRSVRTGAARRDAGRGRLARLDRPPELLHHGSSGPASSPTWWNWRSPDLGRRRRRRVDADLPTCPSGATSAGSVSLSAVNTMLRKGDARRPRRSR